MTGRTATGPGGDDVLLDRVDAYLDVVQRDVSDAQDVGPFTLFVSRAPFPLYGRPRRGAGAVTAAGLDALSARCAEVGMPFAVEWVEEVTPELASLAHAAGLAVERYPLLILTRDAFTPVPTAAGATIGTARTPAEHAVARAVADVGFGSGGTAVGEAGRVERDTAVAAHDPDRSIWFADAAAAGRSVTMTLAVPGEGVVASGTVKPVGGAAEIMGVATLPAARRQGHGVAVTSALVEAAFEHGVDLVLLSADSDDVARVYERLGFRRVGHAGQAERTDR